MLVFAGDAKEDWELNQRLHDDILQQNGSSELVDKDAALPCCRIVDQGPSIRQIQEILPVQMITLALVRKLGARRADSNGRPRLQRRSNDSE